MNDPVPLIGEPVALDLVNTRPHTPAGPVDLLAIPAGLAAWLDLQAGLQAGRLPEPAARLVPADLAAVHAVRDHTAAALDRARRGERPPAAALAGLNQAQLGAPAIHELTWDGATLTAARRRTGPPDLRLAGWLAEQAAILLADPAVTRVRACEAADCVMLFLPAHPRRRWCSPARCGNRTRVARHYHRHHRP
ncbi:hypothetical protein Sru01_30670 [Sphaerisporangium rufum]|uniref:Zinc finger CGNR domain-containing protein n=1 Tax=Sphaerisporangium rufum TaxID=1381558 RepID=A0A919R4B0_9ACTN|nr:ABATE domain-containing protein [Sphaerisporangium rufum]GII78085.1 hypothetical protein Sru01_30670 [Sphaerisporangium rufum]